MPKSLLGHSFVQVPHAVREDAARMGNVLHFQRNAQSSDSQIAAFGGTPDLVTLDSQIAVVGAIPVNTTGCTGGVTSDQGHNCNHGRCGCGCAHLEMQIADLHTKLDKDTVLMLLEAKYSQDPLDKSQIHFLPSVLGLDEARQVEQFINNLVASRSSPQRFDLATPSGTPRGLIADALPPEAVPFAVGEVDPEYEEIIDNFFRPKLLRDFEVGIAGHDLATEAAGIIQDFWRSKCAALGVATSAPLLMPDKVLSSPLDNGANTSTPRISTPTCLSPPSSPPLLSRTSGDVHPIDMDPLVMLKLDPIDKFPVAARDVASLQPLPRRPLTSTLASCLATSLTGC